MNEYHCNHNVIIEAKFAKLKNFKKSKSLNFVRVNNCYLKVDNCEFYDDLLVSSDSELSIGMCLYLTERTEQ